jgi:3-oxoacyl-[acyl-carrier-protein] synthase II
MNKVVITGLGVVSPIGCDIDSFWNACIDLKTNVQKIPKQWKNYSDFRSGIWTPLPNIDFKSHGFSRIEIMQRDPVSLITLMATGQALSQAGIELTPVNEKNRQFYLDGVKSDNAGIFIGTGVGGAKTFLDNHSYQMLKTTAMKLNEENIAPSLIDRLLFPFNINPFVVSMLIPNAISASVGIKYSLHGTNRTISQACSSGTTAIGYAYQAIKSGQIDFAICGGAEYLYDEYGGICQGFDIARTLTTAANDIDKSNRPFDRDRSGFLYSQGGAGILILESEERAKKRDANILAQISGFAETFDAYSMMSINPNGKQIKRMIHKVVNDAELQLTDIDYINTHGTGTKLNDEIESKVIEELFGKKPILNSSKSLLGHGIGASGATEAIVSTLSILNQTTHRCNNLNNPIRDLNFVMKKEKYNIRHALSESFAFGGHNSALVISKYP